jgi:hypothetical protein
VSPETPIVDQLRDATSNGERAGLLLQVPDAVVLEYDQQIIGMLIRHQLWSGIGFVKCRIAALLRVRDAHGFLPGDLAAELEWRRADLSRLAAGHTP